MIDEIELSEEIKRLIATEPIVNACFMLAQCSKTTTKQFLEDCVVELAAAVASLHRAELRRLESTPYIVVVDAIDVCQEVLR